MHKNFLQQPGKSITISLMKLSEKQRFILVSCLLLTLGLLWILANPAQSTSSGLLQAPQNGFRAPDIALNNQDGSQFNLSDYHGQAVIVNFWATWCPPCRAEMPAMQQVYQEYQLQGLEILAVNSTSSDSLAAVTQFTTELGLTFPILLDEFGNTSQTYRVNALPTTFFINRDGIIEEIVYGGPMSEALLRTRVEKILSTEK